MRLAAFAGRFALFIAGMALLTFISLFVVGAYLATWPIMRVSPRSRRLTSLMELATAAMGAARAYGLDKFTETGQSDPEPEAATDDTEDTGHPRPPLTRGEPPVWDGTYLYWQGELYAKLDPAEETRGGE